MQRVYAAYHKNPGEIEKSSSGGMFAAISDAVLKNKGVVIASRYNYDTDIVEYIVCRTSQERDFCRGSKYIQSHMSKEVYKTVEDELKKGTQVLFVGTPCHVAAMKQYVAVKKLNDELFLTCDIICHGVGSNEVWHNFVKWKNKKFDYLTFKDKRKGWLNPLCVAKSENKEISLRGYSWLYFSNAIMRPSCYECRYANINRVGDFSIGDFWKVKSKLPQMFNPRGTSFIMVNTEKAERFFEIFKDDLVYKEVTLDDVMQNNMRHPTKKPQYYSEVMNDLCQKEPSSFFRKWERKLFFDKIKKHLH